MSEQIVAADKKFRNQVIACLVLFTIAGLFFIQDLSFYFDELKSLAVRNPEQAYAKAEWLMKSVLTGNGLFTSIFSIYLIRIALRAWRSHRYPPKGEKVLKETRIIRGAKARTMAAVHFLIAALLLSTNGFLWYFFNLIEQAAKKSGRL